MRDTRCGATFSGSVGAQPSEPVVAILSKTGDWQRFKGLPAPAEPLKVAPQRASRTAAYEVEAKAAAGLAETEAKPRKAAKATRSAEPKAAEPKAAETAEPKAEPKAETPTEEAAPVEVAAAEETPDAGADAQG